MANTDLSYYRNDPYIGGPYVVEWYAAEVEGDIKAGYLVMAGTAANQVKVCSTTGHAFGVAGKIPDLDIDTGAPIGTSIKVYALGVGTHMKIKHDGTDQTVDKGSLLMRSNSLAGACELWAFTYQDNEETCTLSYCIGRGFEKIATGATAIWVEAILGL